MLRCLRTSFGIRSLAAMKQTTNSTQQKIDSLLLSLNVGFDFWLMAIRLILIFDECEMDVGTECVDTHQTSITVDNKALSNCVI